MKNKVFTVTASELNTGNEILINPIPIGYDIETFAQDFNKINYFYPKQISIINNTKADLGINIFSSTSEYNDYLKDNTDYDFILLNDGSVLNNSNALKSQSILVKKLNGFAEANLIIQCINYQDI